MAESLTSSRRKKTAKDALSQQQLLQGVGKLPPQAVDLEEAVLGALMLEKDALTSVIDVLSEECFYSDAHQKIFRVIHELFNQAQPIDILTVTHALKKSGDLELVGGPYYITQLTNRVASAANIEYHARIILQKYIQRELIRMASHTITRAYEDTSDVLQLLDDTEKDLFSLSEGNIRRNYEDMPGLIGRAIKEIEAAGTQTSGVTGVPSGFTELDRITGGWHKQDLIIIAARPAMGKTAFVLSLSRNAAVDFSKPVAFFSLEMSSIQLTNRLIASETEIPSDKLRRGQLARHEWEQLNAKISSITKAPIYIDDTPALNIFELRAKCRRIVAEKKVELIVIDYLQLMASEPNSRAGNREQEISTISRSLKSIAKELNIPVIALSQLSRAVETRGSSKRPQLSDLRESGAIEQDADMVLFIYRPEYYGLDQDEEGASTQGVAEIMVAKNRNGAVKDAKLKFVSHLTRFSDLDTYEFTEESIGLDQPIAAERITRKSKMDDMEDDDQVF